MNDPGAILLAEIREQPEALRRLAERGEEARAIAARLAGCRLVRLVAHGSSDNAASYGVYAFGLEAGMTALRDSISLSVYYQAELDFVGSAVVALSQSGATPDVVAYVERARAKGALTVAVTNEPGSPLAAAAEEVLPLAAGPERSVAATKTYVNSLAALALLAGWCGGGNPVPGLIAAADAVEEAVATLEAPTLAAAVPFAFVGRMYVVGRGLEFATAREIALKLTEICRIAAEPLTATDLVHGPVAAVDPLFPVWTIASDDAALPAVVAAAARARAVGATLVASGPAAERIAEAAYVLRTPAPPSPLLAPLVSVVPGQLFASALARAKGLDPDRPTHLSKVTMTP